jgi:hypothetical protein
MAILDETEFDELIRIQRQMAGMIARESEVDNKIKIIEIVDSLTSPKRKKIQVETILIEAHLQGLSERETLFVIEQLKSDNIIAQSDPGYVIKT